MLSEDDIRYLKNFFVAWDNCNATVNAQKEELSKLTVSLSVVKSKLNTLLAILSAIGVAVLSIAIKMLFGV